MSGVTLSGDGVVTGNTYDKYGSTNPIVRRLMAGFETDLDELLARARPSSLLDVGCGEGVLVQRHGSGTYVAPQPHRVEQSLSQLTSFTEDMARRGMVMIDATSNTMAKWTTFGVLKAFAPLDADAGRRSAATSRSGSAQMHGGAIAPVP